MAKMGRPKKWTKKVIDALALKLLDFTERENLPLFEDFCYQNYINDEYIARFSEQNADFCKAAERLRQKQKGLLLKGGISDKFNSGFTQFVLVNNHGMKNKTESENTHKVTHEVFIKDMIRKAKEV